MGGRCGYRGHIQGDSISDSLEDTNREMNAAETDSRDTLSDCHREFMRSYILREEQRCKAALDRFLARKLNRQGKACQEQEQSKLFIYSLAGL
jgi:hypothetical protein